MGQYMLKNIESEKYRKHFYVAHLPVGSGNDDYVVFLTTTALILARTTKLKQVWEVQLNTLSQISLEEKGIDLRLRDGAKGPFLALPEQESRLWLFSHIERSV